MLLKFRHIAALPFETSILLTLTKEFMPFRQNEGHFEAGLNGRVGASTGLSRPPETRPSADLDFKEGGQFVRLACRKGRLEVVKKRRDARVQQSPRWIKRP